jgi:hypothetical protein
MADKIQTPPKLMLLAVKPTIAFKRETVAGCVVSCTMKSLVAKMKSVKGEHTTVLFSFAERLLFFPSRVLTHTGYAIRRACW